MSETIEITEPVDVEETHDHTEELEVSVDPTRDVLTPAQVSEIITSTFDSGDDVKSKEDAASALALVVSHHELCRYAREELEVDPEELKGVEHYWLAKRIIVRHGVRAKMAGRVDKTWLAVDDDMATVLRPMVKFGSPDRIDGAFQKIVPDAIRDRVFGVDRKPKPRSFREMLGTKGQQADPYMLSDAEQIIGVQFRGDDGQVTDCCLVRMTREDEIGEVVDDGGDVERQFRKWTIVGVRQVADPARAKKAISEWAKVEIARLRAEYEQELAELVDEDLSETGVKAVEPETITVGSFAELAALAGEEQ